MVFYFVEGLGNRMMLLLGMSLRKQGGGHVVESRLGVS